MYEHVSLEFVLAVEGGTALVTQERLLPAVDQHVHLEVVVRLETLLANFTLVFTCRNTSDFRSTMEQLVFTYRKVQQSQNGILARITSLFCCFGSLLHRISFDYPDNVSYLQQTSEQYSQTMD